MCVCVCVCVCVCCMCMCVHVWVHGCVREGMLAGRMDERTFFTVKPAGDFKPDVMLYLFYIFME